MRGEIKAQAFDFLCFFTFSPSFAASFLDFLDGGAVGSSASSSELSGEPDDSSSSSLEDSTSELSAEGASAAADLTATAGVAAAATGSCRRGWKSSVSVLRER